MHPQVRIKLRTLRTRSLFSRLVFCNRSCWGRLAKTASDLKFIFFYFKKLVFYFFLYIFTFSFLPIRLRFRVIIRRASLVNENKISTNLTTLRPSIRPSNLKYQNLNIFNPQAVEMASAVRFNLSNFLEDILQPTSSEVSRTWNKGLNQSGHGI